VAVAFQPKERDQNTLMSEHFSKEWSSPTGEDNYFVTKRDSDGTIAVGVADGVGGWAELGFDSSAISRELCGSIAAEFHKNVNDDPTYLLDAAFKKVKKDGIAEVGGTTACHGLFQEDGILKVANLGDSWAGLFRDNKLISETKIQTHAFNTPYQLAIIPDSILNQRRGNSRFIMDDPKVADNYEFKLEKGDIVLFATDGVIDNIDVKDIEIFLADNEKTDLNSLAKDFVAKVNTLSLDETFPSVFSQELSKLTGQHYTGGKEDDITVVFVKVEY
jgi:protein phosphatase PTC7